MTTHFKTVEVMLAEIGLEGGIGRDIRGVVQHQPPLPAVWGRNDPFFIPPSAEAFRRDLPEADIRFFDTGHFALETHAVEIGAAIRSFLARHVG